MNIKKHTEADKLLIALEGRLDTLTSPQLTAALDESLDSVQELTLDLGGLEYISSAGLRVLLSANKKMKPKGGMKLVNVGETVMEVLEVTGFSEVLTIE